MMNITQSRLLVASAALAVGMWRTARVEGGVQPAPSKTSYELIDEALAAKRIDEETAHKYRVFAGFADSRLPQQFRGANAGFELPPQVLNVGGLLKTFSAQTQAELAPFFMRPDEPGSWLNLATINTEQPPGSDGRSGNLRGAFSIRSRLQTALAARFASRTTPGRVRVGQSARAQPQPRPPIRWRTFSAVNGKAKVWAQDRYPGDAVKAESLAKELTRHIWGTLTRVMDGTEPISDRDVANNGGDGALDFYLLHAPMEADTGGKLHKKFEGLTLPHAGVPCDTRRYIYLDSKEPIGSATSKGMLSTAAHELMHAITLAYGVVDNSGCGAGWIIEASGTWAESFVYPLANAEHIWPDEFLGHPRWPIDIENEKHEYGAYLLPYFMEKAGGGAVFMPKIWTAMKTKKSLDAINTVFNGGWDKQFPLFLNANWNRTPVDRPDGYVGWDGMATNVRAMFYPISVGQSVYEQRLAFDINPKDGPPGLPYLSGAYFNLKFDRSVREVFFDNTVARMPHTSVWGIQKIRGIWKKAEDWSKELSKVWCRDNRNEDLEELILVFGNSDWQGKQLLKPTEDPLIKAYPSGCAAWEGTTTTINVITSDNPRVTITETVTSTMRLVIDSSLIVPGQPREYWKVVSGQLKWSAQVGGACSGAGSGELAIRDMGGGDEVAMLNIWAEDRKMKVMGTQGPWPADIPTFRITCPGSSDPPVDMPLAASLGWFNVAPEHTDLSSDGRSFRGDFISRPHAANAIRFVYRFNVSP